MDVREKYVMQKVNKKEKSICPNCIHHNLCIAENNQPCFECNRFIDANGVTVQEWISVKDRLPENRDDVLVCRTWWNETRNPHIGWYNDVSKEWQILDSDGYYPCGKVTYWMPLPEPPKGE